MKGGESYSFDLIVECSSHRGLDWWKSVNVPIVLVILLLF